MKRRAFLESLFASTAVVGAHPVFASLSRRPSSFQPLLAPGGAAVDLPPGVQTPEFFFRTDNAWCGDFIPFCENGEFHLFYERDWRDKSAHGEGTPWYQVTTRDFVHFVDHGEMIPRGTKQDQDLYIFTGSVIRGEGHYHIFYTGHNPYFSAQNKPQEAVMHAVSDDLLHWKKVPEDTFYAPSRGFEPDDWRDPFVFRNEEAGEYWMLVAARLKEGPSRRRGCTALCVSKDLKKWEVQEPFWSPGLYYTHECPDLFQMGEWWYLVFSEFTDQIRTRYRMSKSLKGPWLAPKNDYFDAKAFYAAKSALNGNHRFLFGWTPTRSKSKDYYQWDWGGSLIVHELVQEADGTLSARIPATVENAWTKPIGTLFPIGLGHTQVDSDRVHLSAPESFGCAASELMPDRCKIEAQIQFEPGTHEFGIMLRTSDDLEASYYIRFEPLNQRMVFDSWPRIIASDQHVSIDGGFMLGLERWIDLKPETRVDLKIIVDHTIVVVYVNNRTAMTARMYNLQTGRWGFFVTQGNAQVRNIHISEL